MVSCLTLMSSIKVADSLSDFNMFYANSLSFQWYHGLAAVFVGTARPN